MLYARYQFSLILPSFWDRLENVQDKKKKNDEEVHKSTFRKLSLKLKKKINIFEKNISIKVVGIIEIV